MSTLPAIPRQNVGLFPSINAPSSFTSQAKKTYRVFIKGKDPIRIPSWHEKLSKFSKSEIAAYRNSHKHNICIDMLSDGYHKSFSELFTLIQKWNASREAAGPGSAIWHQKSLEEQPDKLDQLQHFLTRAEEAQRAGQLEERYKNQLSLALYFKSAEDKWLSDHFFESCLSTAKLIKVDGGKREAEAHSNMGRVHSEHGQLEKAAEHYEAFHHLTLGRAWKDETGRSYKSQACESLWRIYTLLADKMLENKEHEQAIKTLIKAFEMARETGDKKIEGEAAYRVGAAYNSSGDPETAITYLEMSMQIFTELGDKDGIGKTCQALAKAYESQGNIEETMKYLEQFVAVAESSEHSESLLEACMSLGEISNMRGQYERGFEYFEKAYDISKKLKDLKQIQKAQVYIGISKAHIMMATFSSHIKAGGRVNTESLLAWKDN
ncbi:tetratricopeptide repeat protein 29 isoform X1 [Polypterus senegalus]|uniref:tetratricopeptide repeat protein 29 isoform X1 n=1 Tax=Polypterus senegalus TaxID=55291 RepID=UPI001966C05C|nr:tetratricopeptide repeat protein 29 isoform X1 [Polypterus senegalus]